MRSLVLTSALTTTATLTAASIAATCTISSTPGVDERAEVRPPRKSPDPNEAATINPKSTATAGHLARSAKLRRMTTACVVARRKNERGTAGAGGVPAAGFEPALSGT